MKDRYLLLANGTSPHTLKWAKRLAIDFDLEFACFGAASSELEAIVSRERIHAFGVNVRVDGGNIQVISMLPSLVSLVRRTRPAVIHSQYVTSYGFIASLLRYFYGDAAKYVCSAWGSDILITPGKNAAYRYITRYVLRRSDLVTSDSDTMSEEIRSLAGTKIDVVTFPLGMDEFPEEINFLDKDPGLFYSNRAMEPNYRPDLVLRYFKKIAAVVPSAHLVLTNSGSQEPEIKKLADELELRNRVDFRGFVSAREKMELYRHAQFYMSVPISDATSVSLLESMAFGCIPLVSNIPANREWIVDQLNGFFIENGPDYNEMLARAQEIFTANRKLTRARALWEPAYARYVENLDMGRRRQNS